MVGGEGVVLCGGRARGHHIDPFDFMVHRVNVGELRKFLAGARSRLATSGATTQFEFQKGLKNLRIRRQVIERCFVRVV